MKLTLTIIFVSLFFTGFAQFKVSDGSEFDIDPPKSISAYEIYYQPTTTKKPALYLKVQTDNGLRKQVIEMENGKVKSIQNNFYKDTLLEKAIVKYANPKSTEVFYYKYDPITHNQIYAKGYKNGKLIYSYDLTRSKDTIKLREIFNDWWNKSNNETLTTWSQDGLTETAITYTDNGVSPQYTIKKYTSGHGLQMQIDSSRENWQIVEYDPKCRTQKKIYGSRYKDTPQTILYSYDSTGRIKEEQTIIDSSLIRQTEYSYSKNEQLVQSYLVINGQSKKMLSWKTITKFNSEGNEIFKEQIDYKESTEPEIVRRTVSKKTYSNGGIIKYEKQDNYGYSDVFWVKYFERK